MKQLFLLTSCLIQLAAFSQNGKPAPEPSGDCPDGYCPGISIFLETLNLHKPRTNCTRGFGFCLRIKADITCIPCYGKPYLEGETVHVNGYLKENILTLHFPEEMSKADAFVDTNMESFELEDKMVALELPGGKTLYLRAGEYPVEHETNEFIIRIPVE